MLNRQIIWSPAFGLERASLWSDAVDLDRPIVAVAVDFAYIEATESLEVRVVDER